MQEWDSHYICDWEVGCLALTVYQSGWLWKTGVGGTAEEGLATECVGSGSI